jgi:hypothetical protein
VLLDKISVNKANTIAIKSKLDREVPHKVRLSRAPLLARDRKDRHLIPPNV